MGGTVYSSGGSSSSIWSPATTENGGTFPGDHQRLAWTTSASQQQCYQNYSSYYSNMDYLSPAPHQLNVVVSFILLIFFYRRISFSQQLNDKKKKFFYRILVLEVLTIHGVKREMKMPLHGFTTVLDGEKENEHLFIFFSNKK